MSKRALYVLMSLLLITGLGGCGAGGTSSGTSITSGNELPAGAPPLSDSGPGDSGTGTGTAILSWDPPTTNTDGTALTDLAGFKIYCGASPGTYTRTIDIGNRASYTVSDLGPGTYYFVVTAYNVSGSESVYSDEVSKAFL